MARHFWIKNPETRCDGYCVNFNGFLERLNSKGMSFISINYNELLEIINTTTKQEKYSKCKEIYNKKYPQQEEDKIELSKKEQSELEKIFLTHTTHKTL